MHEKSTKLTTRARLFFPHRKCIPSLALVLFEEIIMIKTFVEIGEEMVRGSWGRHYETNIRDTIKGLKKEDELLCVLSYIAKMLRPISEVAQWQIDAKEQKRHEKRDKGREKRKAISKPWREKLAKLRDEDNFEHKYYNKVLDGINNCLWRYEYWNMDWALRTAKQLLSKTVKEWQQKELLILRNVGKITAKGFAEYQKTLK